METYPGCKIKEDNMTPEEYKRYRDDKLKFIETEMKKDISPKKLASLKEKHDALVAGKTIQK
jgi:hypothetical protein